MAMTEDRPRTAPTKELEPGPRRGVFERLAGLTTRRSKPVLTIWLVLVILAAPLAIGLTGALSGAGWDAQGSEAQQVREELRSDFAALGAEAAMVVYRQTTPIAEDPSGLQALVAELGTVEVAERVTDPLSMPPEAGLISQDGVTALVPVVLAGEVDADLPESAAELSSAVRAMDIPEGAQAEVTGEWPVWADFNKSNEEALHKAELLSGIPSLILLVVAFGSLIAAGIPLLLAVSGIAVAFAALNLLGGITPLSVWSMNFSMMIGLAVGIDYSLFIVTRYREERHHGHDAAVALRNTLGTAGKAVFLSALTVVISLAAIFLVPIMVFRSMALGMILAVIATATASLTLLPAVLYLLGDKAVKSRRTHDPEAAAEGRWAQWTSMALKRPKATLALGIVILAALALPALGMRLGMPGPRVVDEGRSSRDGYELVAQSFGEGAAAPAYVTVNASEAEAVVATALTVDGVVDARPVIEPAESGRTVVRVTGSTGVDQPETAKMVETLRTELETTAPSALVGGPAAQNHDLTEVLTGTAPVAIALILIVAFGLLLLVFRSLAVAITSVLMNLLTVGAAFGFATIVFQHGIGAGLIGIEHQGFIDAWAPLFFFALLFGLSMDYQLFLLAAIRERQEATGDPIRAVREGITRTGRAITDAALIMIVVFIAFGVTGPIPPTELGITLAVAVFLDATVVRMLLVPATMALLGHKGWYVPKWLDRILPRISFNH